MSVPVLLILMLHPIVFFEIPDEYQIELEFDGNRKPETYRCRCDVSYNNKVMEVYDESDEIIAICMEDLVETGSNTSDTQGITRSGLERRALMFFAMLGLLFVVVANFAILYLVADTIYDIFFRR